MSSSSSSRQLRAGQTSSLGPSCRRTRATWSTPMSALTGAPSAGCCRASWTIRERPAAVNFAARAAGTGPTGSPEGHCLWHNTCSLH